MFICYAMTESYVSSIVVPISVSIITGIAQNEPKQRNPKSKTNDTFLMMKKKNKLISCGY